MVGGPGDLAELETSLSEIGKSKQWSTYEKVWETAQKADRGKGVENTNLWRSRDADEYELAMSQAHIATGSKLAFNPIFGTGGNAGARDFTKGWDRAVAFVHNLNST